MADGDVTDVRRARLHHVNFFTTRLDEMTDWYGRVLGAEIVFRFPLGAWLTNDEANHRIALVSIPALEVDVDKRSHARMHHVAFEYPTFADLDATYVRLRAVGIEPRACLDHGMTLSYYYADPDGNYVELQCDVFGDWAVSKAWMETSPDFAANPIGAAVDPARVADAHGRGMTLDEIHRRIWATDDFRPAEPPDLGGPPPRPGDPPLPLKW